MTHRNTMKMISAVAALTLCPALVLAQAPSGSAPPVAAQGSDAQSGTGPTGHGDSAMTGAQKQRALGGAQQSIDPSEVQKVFGTEASLIDLRSLGAEEIRSVQQSLQERGHYRGQVDGVVGPQTRAALNALLADQYALNQRLINQGQIAGQLAASLGIDAQGVSPVSGSDSNHMDKPNGQATQQRSKTQRSNASGSSSSRPPTSPSPSGSSSSPSSSGSSSSGSTTDPHMPR